MSLLAIEEIEIIAEEDELNARDASGDVPDYGSGPHLALMAQAVRLARLDTVNPIYSADSRAWLDSDIVALFADCIGYEGNFND